MKFLKKLFFLVIFIIVGYGLLVFITPGFADTIENALGITGINKKIRTLKGDLDSTSTQNLEDMDIIKTAKDLQDKATKTINQVKGSIDDVRGGINSSVETYEDMRGEVEKTIDDLNETTKKIDEVRKKIQEAKDDFVSTGSTNK